MDIVRGFLFRFGIFLALFFVGVDVVSFGFPWVFELTERITSSPLLFEDTLRISILGIHTLFLLLTGAWVLSRGNRTHAAVWWAFVFSGVILAGIFFGDRTHRLLEEFSWIRYSTSAFLILASLCGLLLFVRTARRSGFLQASFWLVLSGGFLYGGLDEVMEIHEAIGRFLQKALSYSGEVTDYVTIGYAFVALVVIFLLIRARIGEFFSRYRISAYLFLSGVCVYAISTACDTVDVIVHAKMVSFARAFTADPSFVMSDAWHLLWSVKNSFNGFEEVFEHTAALLFLLALICVLFDSVLKEDRSHSRGQWRKKISVGIVVASTLGVAALGEASLPFTFPSSVVETPGVRVTKVASVADGLFHADDLAFHRSQGLIVANEGGRSVYRLRDGRFIKLLDQKKIIRDPDSVAASERGVFVSDGNSGTIIRFDGQESEIIANRGTGLVHPEGIAVAGDTLYILDESKKTLSRLTPDKKIEIWKPDHPDWQAPEGIAYDPSKDILFVTDDTTGAIFRVTFGKALEKIAELSAPEDIEVLDDGSMLVTDTAWGAIFRIFPDGRKEKIVQFARMYRDTQGVAVDEQGSVYVITSDGFASTSFMPSFLFHIDDIHL